MSTESVYTTAAPLNPWSWPTRPWTWLHLDFAGPFLGRMFLILIDAHSKWIEAYKTASAVSTVVMQELRTTFARFGLPETIVTDNGTCFINSEFEEFLQKNGIRHITSAPYHPASNRLAERAVQMLKKGSRWLLRVAFLIDLLMCCYPIGSRHKEQWEELLRKCCWEEAKNKIGPSEASHS